MPQGVSKTNVLFFSPTFSEIKKILLREFTVACLLICCIQYGAFKQVNMLQTGSLSVIPCAMTNHSRAYVLFTEFRLSEFHRVGDDHCDDDVGV